MISLYYARTFVSCQHWHRKIWPQIADYIIIDWIKNPVGGMDRVVALNDRGKALASELISIKHHEEAFTSPGLCIAVKEARVMNFSQYTTKEFEKGLRYIFGKDILIKRNYPCNGAITGIIDNTEERFVRFSNYIKWHTNKDLEAIKNMVAKEIWGEISKHSDLLWDNHSIEVSGWGFKNSSEEAELYQYDETS